ncbi:MAG: histidine kinase dimerization/phosphoacceptor domain -containing protein [Alkalispirochaetaceae bacterium]
MPGSNLGELDQIGRRWDNEIGTLADAFSGTLDRIRREMRARAASQEELAASLEEKELLLREVHHRVKNNLQPVVSMLVLQRRQHQGEAADDVLIGGAKQGIQHVPRPPIIPQIRRYRSDSSSPSFCSTP